MSNDTKHPQPWGPRPEPGGPDRSEDPTPLPQAAEGESRIWVVDVFAALVVIAGTILIVLSLHSPGTASDGRELGAVRVAFEFVIGVMFDYALGLLVVMLTKPLYALAYFASMLWLIIRFEGWRRSRRAPRQE